MSSLDLSDEPRIRGRSSRPRLRLVLLVGFVAFASAGSLLLWRYTTLTGLPDIGEPFDVARYARIEIPEGENAFTYYRRAYELSRDLNDPRSLNGTYTDWSRVEPAQLKYLEESRAALAVWLAGTGCERSSYIQPGEYTFETLLPITQDLRQFARRANLQAFKLQHEGDLAGAWTWLRANLRCARHSGMNGCFIEQLVGNAIYRMTASQINGWADDPKIDARLLRAALDDVRVLDKLERKPSQAVRADYYSSMAALKDLETCERLLTSQLVSPPQTGQVSWFPKVKSRLGSAIAPFRHEPERSRRVMRLVVANWLSACDLPAEERRKRLRHFNRVSLYDPAPGESPPISPEELARWLDTTRYAREFVIAWKNVEPNIGNDVAARATLIVHLADRLYTVENGKPPAKVEDLVGRYLDSIPAGYVAPGGEIPAKETAR